MLVPFRPDGRVYSIEALREDLARQEALQTRSEGTGPDVKESDDAHGGKPERSDKQTTCKDGSKHKRKQDTEALPDEWERAERTLKELYLPPFHEAGTWRRMRYVLRLLARCSERLAADPTAGHVDRGPEGISHGLLCKLSADLLDDGHARSGVNSIMRVVSAMLNHFEDERLLGLDIDGRPKVSVMAGRRRKKYFLREGRPDPMDEDGEHLSIDEMQRLLALADREWSEAASGSQRFRAGRRRALVYLVGFSGLRKTEALTLRWKHVDFDRRIVWVVEPEAARLKTDSSPGPTPMPEALAAMLAEWRLVASGQYVLPQWTADKPWRQGRGKYRPTDDVSELAVRAGIAGGVTLVGLRKTWSTHAESAWGFSREQIQRVLRHTDAKTQDWYREADVDNLRAMAVRISYGPGVSDQ